MQREPPGFLAKLIALCPVISQINALPAPRTVLEATSEMFEENDLAGQFREDMRENTQRSICRLMPRRRLSMNGSGRHQWRKRSRLQQS